MKQYEVLNLGNKKGKIRIIGGIGWWETDSKSFTRQVDALLADGVQDIEVYLNTPGGDMFHANEIGNQLQRFPGQKTGRLGAMCASAGTLIATYVDTVEGSSNTQYMIHDPSMLASISRMADWDSQKKMYENLRNNALDRYEKKTKLKRAVLDAMMEATTWMTAKEAKEKGFVDSIADEPDNTVPQDAANVLKMYGLEVPAILNSLLTQPPSDTMNNEVKRALGLPETATDEQVRQAIENLKKPDDNPGLKALQVLAESKGLKWASLEAFAKADFEGCLNFVKEAETKTAEPEKTKDDSLRLSDLLAELKGANTQKPALTLDDYEKNDPKGLRKLIREQPQAYAKLFKEKYGVEPDLSELKNI